MLYNVYNHCVYVAPKPTVAVVQQTQHRVTEGWIMITVFTSKQILSSCYTESMHMMYVTYSSYVYMHTVVALFLVIFGAVTIVLCSAVMKILKSITFYTVPYSYTNYTHVQSSIISYAYRKEVT